MSRTSVGLVFFAFTLGACGAPEPSVAFVRQAIVDGAPDTQHDAVVAVISFDNLAHPTNGATCSGTVVHVAGGEATLLTAAHCFERLDAGWSTLVNVGPDYAALRHLQLDAGIPVRKIVIHPFYQKLSGDQAFDDYALATFDAPAGLSELPVLPKALDDLAAGSAVTLVGFGSTDHTTFTNTTRQFVTRPIASLTQTDLTIDQTAQQGGQCIGDSGGPALYETGGQTYVAGVMSHGDMGCVDHGVSGRLSREEEFVSRYVQGLPPATVMTCEDCQARGSLDCSASCVAPVIDSGVVDAGTPDAGPVIDAGTPDAGAVLSPGFDAGNVVSGQMKGGGCSSGGASLTPWMLGLIAVIARARRLPALPRTVSKR